MYPSTGSTSKRPGAHGFYKGII